VRGVDPVAGVDPPPCRLRQLFTKTALQPGLSLS
jgi:hypothetical protein